jgi:hypothetical protein
MDENITKRLELWVPGRRLWWTCDGKRLPAVVRQVLRPSSKNVYCHLLIPDGWWEQRSLDKASLTERDEEIPGEPKVGSPPA